MKTTHKHEANCFSSSHSQNPEDLGRLWQTVNDRDSLGFIAEQTRIKMDRTSMDRRAAAFLVIQILDEDIRRAIVPFKPPAKHENISGRPVYPAFLPLPPKK